jgi:protein-disulfide isomerase
MRHTHFHKVLFTSLFVLLAFAAKTAQAASPQTVSAAQAQQLFHTAQSPIEGNANGDVNIVDFFDYQCGHCKTLSQTLYNLSKHDPNIRIIFKELPILGDESEAASKAALAAAKQGKYLALHNQLMASNSLSKADILAAAKKAGLNMSKFRHDWHSHAIKHEIQKNLTLSQDLNINGTPTLVIAKNMKTPGEEKVYIFAGALTESELRATVNRIRKS